MIFLNRQEEGQSIVEYALLLVLVAVVAIAILSILGTQIRDAFAYIWSVMQ